MAACRRRPFVKLVMHCQMLAGDAEDAGDHSLAADLIGTGQVLAEVETHPNPLACGDCAVVHQCRASFPCPVGFDPKVVVTPSIG